MTRLSRVLLAVAALATSNTLAAEHQWPGEEWPTAAPAAVGMDAQLLQQARQYAETGGGAGYVLRNGKLVLAWGDAKKRFDLKSTSKSIGVTALGLAIADQKIALSDNVATLHPEFVTPEDSKEDTARKRRITIQHLATQTAGFEKPGGYGKLIFDPGSKWSYSDGGPNWLAECVTLAYQKDVADLMFERVFQPIGISHDDLTWRSNSYRPKQINGIARREFGSGISANVDAMARIGYLYLRNGKWQGRQLIPAEFVTKAASTIDDVVGLPEVDEKNYGNASDHYGLLWWNNADGTLPNVPRDAYWSWGLYDSLIVVIPSLDIVVARAGKSWNRDWGGHYDVLRPFFDPIVASAKPAVADATSSDNAPYPSSSVIKRIDWAPANTILRNASGSDNWPLTWGDDDAMYTAYGDGKGFRPFVDRKLSMGLCRIVGGPANFVGANLRSPTTEQVGDGAKGMKASGILMVDGVLYLLVRNAGNSTLAWSEDHGKTWTWSDWKFETSFGCPTFLNFGANYAQARDDYVYIYSQDSNTAYERADRMVLARVMKTQLRDRSAYEFFAGMEKAQPVFTSNINQRAAVFEHAGQCYRSSVTYNSALKRYLWCQTGRGEDTRFRGGFAIYDAPQPWGPWTTAFFTNEWDMGPGESSSLPTKWMSDDGKTVHLVFSGDDHFSVRQAKIVLVD